jgi:hypothetical protein
MHPARQRSLALWFMDAKLDLGHREQPKALLPFLGSQRH